MGWIRRSCVLCVAVVCAITATSAATQTVAGWGTAVQGTNNSLHFISAVDGHAWSDQLIGPAFGPPSIARFANSSGTGWGIAVQGANNTLHFVWAYDGQPWTDQPIGTASGPPSIARFSTSAGAG